MAALIGCSGWSYDDWVGRFYPSDLAKKKGEWLSYYSRFFSTVEINSTFYRVLRKTYPENHQEVIGCTS